MIWFARSWWEVAVSYGNWNLAYTIRAIAAIGVSGLFFFLLPVDPRVMEDEAGVGS